MQKYLLNDRIAKNRIIMPWEMQTYENVTDFSELISNSRTLKNVSDDGRKM